MPEFRYEVHGVLAGAKTCCFLVDVWSVRDQSRLSRTFTFEDGVFVAVLPQGLAPGTAVRVRATDSKGLALAARTLKLPSDREILKTRLRVDGSALRKAEPLAGSVQRLGGRMVDPIVFKVLERAVQKIARSEREAEVFAHAVKAIVPPLARDEHLLEDAWSLLDGLAESPRHFETRLRSAAKGAPPLQGVEPGQEWSKIVMERLAAHGPKVSAEITLYPDERYLPVAAAALLIARDTEHAHELVRLLEEGLRGSGVLEAVYRSGLDFVRGTDPGSFRDALSKIAEHLNFPGDPFWPGPGRVPSIPGFPDIDSGFLGRYECVLHDLETAIRSRGGYYIDSITEGCPGAQIVIDGRGFGLFPGEVVFPASDGELAVRPALRDWTSDRILVAVPAGAVSGVVRLRVRTQPLWFCNRTSVALFRYGQGRYWAGGNPVVRSFSIDIDDPACVAPESNVLLAWEAAQAPVSLRVTDQFDGGVLLDRNDLPATGTVEVAMPAVTEDHSLLIVASVQNACGLARVERQVVISVKPILCIEGIEVTQGIQTFDFDPSAANTVPTVAHKDTIVRVYVSSDRGGFNNDETEVTGSLEIDGHVLAPINGLSPVTLVGTPFIIARRRDLIDRSQTDHTLNFRIPAALAEGAKDLAIVVEAPTEAGSPSTGRTSSWEWSDHGTLRIRYVRVRTTDTDVPGGSLEPTDAEARFTIERAVDLLPTPVTDIAPARVPIHETTLDYRSENRTPPGQRVDVRDDLSDLHDCRLTEWLDTVDEPCPAEDRAIWVGIVRNSIGGVARSSLATALSSWYRVTDLQACGRRILTAHEIGHALGLGHTDTGAGSPSRPDPHPNGGFLSDVPFDPFWNTTVAAPVADFMSYDAPRWVSAHNWNRLLPEVLRRSDATNA